jgi:translation initiation factor RLI1
MTTKVALVDYDKCQAEKCDHGVCAAAAACTHKLLKQEELYEAPISYQSMCLACSDCVKACPFGAIKMVKM